MTYSESPNADAVLQQGQGADVGQDGRSAGAPIVFYACQTLGLPDHDRCNALSDAGHDVRVLDWSSSATQYVWKYEGVRRYAVETLSVGPGGQLSTLAACWKLLTRTAETRPDLLIVYGYQNPVFFILALFARATGSRVVSMNDSKEDDYPRTRLRELAKFVMLWPYHGMLAATERARDYLRKFSRRPMLVYHCAIDTQRVGAAAAETWRRTNFSDRNFIVVARFVPKKNIPLILHAFERYASVTVRPRRLILCGYGPDEDRLRRQISRSEILREHVSFVGFVPADEVPRMIGGSLALILASEAEQFGIVVTEALAAGVPAVVTRQCGAADLISDGQNGYLVNLGDSKTLASTMAKLDGGEGPWRAMSEQARQSAMRADVSVFVDAVRDLARNAPSTLASDEDAPRPRVAIIYHFFPHYRAPVLRALADSCSYRYAFWGAHEGLQDIEPFRGDDSVTVRPLRLIEKHDSLRLRGSLPAILDRGTSALIILGNPNITATWSMALIGRLLGKKVFFWSHGWLKREPRAKAALRNLYFRLAHGVFVYGDRARELAGRSGFPVARVHAIYNSLDWTASEPLYAELLAQEPQALRASVTPWPELPLLVCTARLTKLCRFDLLMQAMAALQQRGLPTSLILVGDGPERHPLEQLAARLDLRVQFNGAIYDEAALARVIFASDVTVSPGKVGLAAMHSLTYGTPVITHGDLDAQMPEVEAITPGETGAFFDKDDVADLARKIEDWLKESRDRFALRERCRSIISERYTPEVQRTLIERVLSNFLNKATND